MKRFLLKLLLIFIITSLVACAPTEGIHEIIIAPIPVEDRLAQIDELFATQDFEGIKEIYDAATGEDMQIIKAHLNEYALMYIDTAKQDLLLKPLLEFQRTGFAGESLALGIDLVERLIASEAAYTQGKIAFNGRDFETAKERLGAVDPEYTNYEMAMECLAEITNREQMWQDVVRGRNPGTYALAVDEDYVYIAYEHMGTHGILKTDITGMHTDFIPLSDAGDFTITGINIVGDYIYFIAGEDVGRGLMFDNPYCIYEMKTDGTGLAKIASGDYFDMVIYNSQVYALSYTKGLVQLTDCFSTETVLANGNIIEISAQPDGIYYTVQDNLTSENVNTVYLFDGETHEQIMSGDFLHYYVYDQNTLKLYSSGSTGEKLYLETQEGEMQIASADIMCVYGLIGDAVIYSTPGNHAQERLTDYNIKTQAREVYTALSELPKYYIAGLSYEREQIFAAAKDGIIIMDIGFENAVQIKVPEIDTSELEANMALVRHLSDVELYSQETIVVVLSDELIWYYSDAILNVTIEKRYFEESECTAYITHIRTMDFSLLTTDSWGDSEDSRLTAGAAKIAEKYGIIYGQSTDYFNYNDDTRRGIVIRKGEVYRDHIYKNMLAIYPDGSFVTYVKGDTISAARLIEEGVQTTLSFGPILVEDGYLSSSSIDSKVAVRNPRSAIGMVQPGHYVSIVVDGRSSASRGLTTVELGELFAQEGCEIAYNLDGGGTVALTFLGNSLYLSTSYRDIPDMLYFGTSNIVPLNLNEFTMTYDEYMSTDEASNQE